MKRRTLLMSGSVIPAAFAAEALASSNSQNSLSQTDPDFARIEDYLLKTEMPQAGQMPAKTRAMVTLAALTTMTAETRLAQATADALKAGMNVVEIKETLYQCAPYIGITRVESALKTVKHCELCNTLSDEAICPICADESRDRTKLCVVESPADQRVIEETMAYRGLYFVLMGLVSPVKGIGAQELHLEKLLQRVRNDQTVREVLIATPYSPEGDATAHFIAKALRAAAPQVRVTRLARGIPAGVELEYTDANTIAGAIFARR